MGPYQIIPAVVVVNNNDDNVVSPTTNTTSDVVVVTSKQKQNKNILYRGIVVLAIIGMSLMISMKGRGGGGEGKYLTTTERDTLTWHYGSLTYLRSSSSATPTTTGTGTTCPTSTRTCDFPTSLMMSTQTNQFCSQFCFDTAAEQLADVAANTYNTKAEACRTGKYIDSYDYNCVGPNKQTNCEVCIFLL